eukprot:Rmarinus@m.5026
MCQSYLMRIENISLFIGFGCTIFSLSSTPIFGVPVYVTKKFRHLERIENHLNVFFFLFCFCFCFCFVCLFVSVFVFFFFFPISGFIFSLNVLGTPRDSTASCKL